MECKDLLGYLTTVLELEKQCRTMHTAILNYDGWIRKLEAIERQAEISKPGDKPVYDFKGFIGAFLMGGGGCGILGALFVFIANSLKGLLFGLFDWLFTLVKWSGYAIWIFGAVLCIWSVLATIQEFFEARKDFAKRQEQYNIDVANRAEAITQASKKKKSLLADRQILYKQYVSSKKVLSNYYSLNVIYPSYRSIVPVAMFTQYIQSRRCDKLEGAEGAYNKYESEIRQNIIIAKLDVIIEKLDHIATSQYELQQTLIESNRQVQTLCQAGFQAQERHMRVIEYQNQQSIQVQQAMGQYMVYRDLIRS